MGKDKDLTLADRLKSVDFYKSLPKELAEPTVSGASCNHPNENHLIFHYSLDVGDGFDRHIIHFSSAGVPVALAHQRDHGGRERGPRLRTILHNQLVRDQPGRGPPQSALRHPLPGHSGRDWGAHSGLQRPHPEASP